MDLFTGIEPEAKRPLLSKLPGQKPGCGNAAEICKNWEDMDNIEWT